MISFLVNIFVPANSNRGKSFRALIDRIRNKRAAVSAKNRYNLYRQKYYKHAVTRIPKKQLSKISIVVPCFNTPKKYFEPLLASIFAQGYENWELVLVDASDDKQSENYLKQRANSDKRIKYIRTENAGIAHNTNKGIAEAKGEFIAFLDHDDTLDQNALSENAELFASRPELSLVYSDEDKISDDSERFFEPHFKPDFSLDLLRNVNYITHFVVARKELVDKLKGIRSGFDGAQDYDFLLRAADQDIEIGHIPKILYHWRQADGSTALDFTNKQHVTDAGCRALEDHYERRGIKGVAVSAIENRPGFYKTKYSLDSSDRKIYVNLSSTNLIELEKKYILDKYRNNVDVKKHKIKVIEGKPDIASNHNLVINGAFIPASSHSELAPLFGLSEENGVNAVAPRIICHGRIFDAGIVNTSNGQKNLFKGINPKRPMVFGSIEWVRNVDKLSGNVMVGSKKDEGNQRNVVWTHTDFIALKPKLEVFSKERNFYNPNLDEYTELVEENQDYITDFVEIKK